jgi:small subunit ribosomal protein S1
VRWPVDSTVEGVVKRVAEFGAFVELTPGVEGLIHISELTDERVRRVEDVVKIGQAVKAKVLEVDEERRRMSLSIRALKESPDYMGEVSAEPAAPAAPPKKRKKPLKGGLEW